MNATQSKPSIVFGHRIWADGSSFSKVIPALQAEGHQVIAAQYGLDTLAGDRPPAPLWTDTDGAKVGL
jgi:hypothetical protein